MKLVAYSCREDEINYFEKYGNQLSVEVIICRDKPKKENADLVKGCQAVSILTTAVHADLIEIWKDMGVKAISTRTIGFDHIDLKKAQELEVKVSNVSYTASTVADYAIMTLMMSLRKMKTILFRGIGQDYSLPGICGKDLPNLTIGVIGTGKIGETVIRHLSGFGCKILAFDPYEKESVKTYAQYVDLDTLFGSSDAITLHAPATEHNYHMINKDSMAKMKDGVIIVNTARGQLIDTYDLIAALETGKIGGAALDVVEHEMGIYYKDFKHQVIIHRELAVLNAMPNVLMTPHTAFYTDQAVSDMVENSIRSCLLSTEGKENPWEVF